MEVPTLLRRLCLRRVKATEQLKSAGYEGFHEARSRTGSGDWDPIVVVCGPAVDEEDMIALVEVGSDPRTGSAIVASGDTVGAAQELTLRGPRQGAWLSSLGGVIVPQGIERDELDSASALLGIAAGRASMLASDEPYVNLPISLPAPRAGPSRNSDLVDAARIGNSADPEGHFAGHSSADHDSPTAGHEVGGIVEVAVLGPIEIHGAARDFTRAWARELVVYLSMHPHGASNESWATALWPDRLMAPSSLHSTASVARRSLGSAPDGRDHLPRSHGRLQLSGSVVTDWDRFVRLADSPRFADWRSALELVRGRPFQGLRSTDWPILEGIGPAIEAAVVDLSGRLAGAYLATGRPYDAQWAARKGLLVSPYDERLYRMLMRAADAAGNPAGVEGAMRELIQLVADDIEPFDSIHPATVDLYRSLSRRQSRPGRGPTPPLGGSVSDQHE